MKKFTLIIILVFCMSILSACTKDAEPKIKNVENYSTTITLVLEGESIDIDGTYTGEMLNDMPHGNGVFSLEFDGVFAEIDGVFTESFPDGKTFCTFTDAEMTYDFEMTFSKGELALTSGEFFNVLGQIDLFGVFALDSDVMDFVDSNPNLFPIATKEAIQTTTLQEFSAKQFRKTRAQETLGLVKMNLYAAQVFEDNFEDLSFLPATAVTYVLGIDDDFNYYAIYYLGSVEIYDGDKFTAYALPCATTSFDNVGGGTTNVIVMLASYME